MTDAQFRNLKEGDIVRNKSSLEPMIVTANFGGRVTVVRTSDVTNPAEWELLKKASHEEVKP